MSDVEIARINTSLAALAVLNALCGFNRQASGHKARLASGKYVSQRSEEFVRNK